MRNLYTILLVFAICIFSKNLFAQSTTTETTSNFFGLQSEINAFYEANPQASGQKHWKRQEWFYEPRLYPTGQMKNITTKTWKAKNKYDKTHYSERSAHGVWTFLGPTDHINNDGFGGGKGRINSMALHPSNNQIIYAGTSQGGLWQTMNGGNNWVDLTPHLPMLAISDVVLDPSNSNIIYIVTGDPNPCSDCINGNTGHTQLGRRSIGILRSTDGGQTWNPIGLTAAFPGGNNIYKLLIHPTNSSIQMVASSAGVIYTDNAWASHETVSSSRAYDIEFKPGDPSIVYASGFTKVRRSTDGGLTWATVDDPDFPNFIIGARTELAVSPSSPNGVYFIVTSAQDSTRAILRSFANGTDNSWTLMDGATSRFGGAGFYNLAMAVRPDNFNHLYVGKVSFGRSTTGGTSSSWSTTMAGHADIHDLQIKDNVLYCANDGGLYKSLNYGDTWTEISQGIGNSEIYRMSGTPQNSNFFVIGAQDIGSLKRTSSNTTFTTMAGADGMVNMIDYTDAARIIISGQRGFFFKTETGGPATTNITPGNRAEWVTPAIMDPVVPDIIFVAKDSMYRSSDFGDNWTWFSGPILANMNVLAQGRSNRNRLYASTDSRIWQMNSALSASGTTTWTDISDGLPNLFISDIVVNPTNSFEVFITMSGYNEGEKVFRSQNAGVTWFNISGSLPNVPANCIAYHDVGTNNDHLYIGTDLGVFYRNDDLDDWVYFSNQMPSVAVTDLYINPNNNTIAAATYGRGLWRSDLYSGCVFSQTLSAAVEGVKHYSATNTILSTVEYLPKIGTEINYNAGNYIDLREGFLLGGHAQFVGRAEGCSN